MNELTRIDDSWNDIARGKRPKTLVQRCDGLVGYSPPTDII